MSVTSSCCPLSRAVTDRHVDNLVVARTAGACSTVARNMVVAGGVAGDVLTNAGSGSAVWLPPGVGPEPPVLPTGSATLGTINTAAAPLAPSGGASWTFPLAMQTNDAGPLPENMNIIDDGGIAYVLPVTLTKLLVKIQRDNGAGGPDMGDVLIQLFDPTTGAPLCASPTNGGTVGAGAGVSYFVFCKVPDAPLPPGTPFAVGLQQTGGGGSTNMTVTYCAVTE